MSGSGVGWVDGRYAASLVWHGSVQYKRLGGPLLRLYRTVGLHPPLYLASTSALGPPLSPLPHGWSASISLLASTPIPLSHHRSTPISFSPPACAPLFLTTGLHPSLASTVSLHPSLTSTPLHRPLPAPRLLCLPPGYTPLISSGALPTPFSCASMHTARLSLHLSIYAARLSPRPPLTSPYTLFASTCALLASPCAWPGSPWPLPHGRSTARTAATGSTPLIYSPHHGLQHLGLRPSLPHLGLHPSIHNPSTV